MRELTAWSGSLDAEVVVPGDKSLTHRGILMSALAHGVMEIDHWLDAADTRASLGLVANIGVKVVEETAERLVLQAPERLWECSSVIDCGNSGTTMRLGLGILAAVPGLSVLTGDASLRRRPMARVVDPLKSLGLNIWTRSTGLAPLAMLGGEHQGGYVPLNVASAQVKSAILLAGLSAQEPVMVKETIPTRDHTERLIKAMGGQITTSSGRIEVKPSALQAVSFRVPGDPSSAAFWATLAALDDRRQVTIPSILFNPTRTQFFRVLEAMGAGVSWTVRESVPEPWGELLVKGGRLRPVEVVAEEVPAMIDEIPLVALLATQCEGVSVIRGAQELRVKESDRIAETTRILSSMGADIEEFNDGWQIHGPTPLHGAQVDAQGDHRMAMLAAVAATIAHGVTQLRGEEAVAISYPEFYDQYHTLQRITGAR